MIDADGVESDAATLPGGGRLETDETVETVITVAAPTSAPDDSAADVEMTSDPEAESLVIQGVRDRELDPSQFWEAVDDALTWSFDGTYQKVQFYKDDGR